MITADSKGSPEYILNNTILEYYGQICYINITKGTTAPIQGVGP